jgi:hypothetical protein
VVVVETRTWEVIVEVEVAAVAVVRVALVIERVRGPSPPAGAVDVNALFPA